MTDFTSESIRQGRKNQEASLETPESFATIDGASQARDSMELSNKNQRMAGEVGARAKAMMNDPVEIQRTNNWMQMFEAYAPQGMIWKQAKMGGMEQPQQ